MTDYGQDVMAALMLALCEPERITPRAPRESVESWQRRAVILHVVPYIEWAVLKAAAEPATHPQARECPSPDTCQCACHDAERAVRAQLNAQLGEQQ